MEALLLARLLKSEDQLPENLVRSAAFLFGADEAQILDKLFCVTLLVYSVVYSLVLFCIGHCCLLAVWNCNCKEWNKVDVEQ